ncbi:MAG: hypothetical protein RLZZ242_398 [Bacteroidota bacterium]|jgi:hypothetical protein
MKTPLLLALLFLSAFCWAQKQPHPKVDQMIDALFEHQIKAWNEADVTRFMLGYWNDERLIFVGSAGPTYGYQNTLNGYKKRYPDPKAMGRLAFDILEKRQWDRRTVQVIGRFTLYREKDTPTGHFSLLLRKMKGQWVIVSDHSS